METKSLKAWRELRAVTQYELAKACDVTVGAIQGVESGRNEPHVGLALKIARALDVQVEQVAWTIKNAQSRPRGKEADAA
jgi:DNA-binding XRE family transcriptional regulator